jgi:hypothetical protein
MSIAIRANRVPTAVGRQTNNIVQLYCLDRGEYEIDLQSSHCTRCWRLLGSSIVVLSEREFAAMPTGDCRSQCSLQQCTGWERTGGVVRG